MGGAGATRTMTWILDKKHSYSMMLSTCLTMGTRPLSPSPSSPFEAPKYLQHNVEHDVSDAGNAPMGALHRGQGRKLGGE